MIQFRLFKIPISIHWMFFALTALLGGATRASTPYHWQMVLLFMIAAFVSILIHELGHAAAGLARGAPYTQIQLHGMGGTASFPSGRFSRWDQILVTAAGPGASILLAILSFAVMAFVAPFLNLNIPAHEMIARFLSIMLTINIFWTVFNLLPVLPLDGGQIVREALGPRRIKTTCVISFVALAIAAVALWMRTGSIYNMLIIGLLGMHTYQVWKSTQ